MTKGGLPHKIIINPKNDAYVITTVTRSGWTLGKDVVDLHKDRMKGEVMNKLI